MSVYLHEGDCLDVLKTMPSESVDSVVTDPPYGLSFMGRKWDYDVPTIAIWQETLRVLKPGGHLLSFSGTRTYHRMVVAIEDAGFEIRDQIGWLYGSGFPKTPNALKPAWEPIVLARKASSGTVAENIVAHGTGAINIGECRVQYTSASDFENAKGGNSGSVSCDMDGWGFKTAKPQSAKISADGRWPANVIHDGSDEVLEAFAASGERGAGGGKQRIITRNTALGRMNDGAWKPKSIEGALRDHGDTGTAARFFYCAKTSKAERNGSKHPTVKPVSLMRYLCRLVTPPNGIVLDPFAGTGTTGQAAIDEGFSAILIEQEPEYCATIRWRLALWLTPAPDPAALTQRNPSVPSPDANQDSSQDISSPPHGSDH